MPEIKSVNIKENALGRVSKFIIAEISDGEDKTLVLYSSNQEFHKEMMESLSAEIGRGFIIEPKGGGRLFADLKSKKIWIWGESTVYGPPDYSQVKKLLETNYKKFKIILNEHSTK